MKLPEVVEVEYPAPRSEDSINLRRISSADAVTKELAAGTMFLLADAYVNQFEEPNGPIPAGTFARRYDPEDEALLQRHQERMLVSIEKNSSQYWVTTSHEGAIAFGGLVKASPSRATRMQKAFQDPPNLYFNDLIVAKELQRQGIGASLAHVVLRFGGYEDDRQVIADGFKINAAFNSRLERVGMFVLETAVQPYEVNGIHRLEMARYSTPMGTVLAGIRERLETRYQTLRSPKI